MKTFIFLLLFIPTVLMAQKKTVKATVLLKVEPHHCVEELRNKAIEQAKLQAIADVFGTVLQQGIETQTESTTKGDKSTSQISSQSIINTEVKGEWLKTLQEEICWILKEEPVMGKIQQILYIQAKVKGKAKKIEKSKVDLIIKTLTCEDIHCSTTFFKDKEPIYLYFRTPKSGFVNVFLTEEDTVFRLFPYKKVKKDALFLEADKDYILFSANYAKRMSKIFNPLYVDEYYLDTQNKSRKLYQLYVIFSQKKFIKPHLETTEYGMKVILKQKFLEWILKNKQVNDSFQETIIYLTVKN